MSLKQELQIVLQGISNGKNRFFFLRSKRNNSRFGTLLSIEDVKLEIRYKRTEYDKRSSPVNHCRI